MKKNSKSGGLLKALQGGGQPSPSTASVKSFNSGDTRSSSLQGSTEPKSINFGREPKAAAGQTSSKSSELTGFIQNTLTHGLTGSGSSLFSGSGLLNLSGIGSLGSLASSLAGLFGGGSSTPAPLPAFSLPGSQIQTLTVRSSEAAEVTTVSQPSSSYGQLPDSSSAATSLVDQHQQIAQAVKTALLQSHSLSDVISEL